MKISIDLPADDVEFLDAYVNKHGESSRSAAVQDGIRLLRHRDLSVQYEAAMGEWLDRPEAAAWDNTVGDGMDAPRLHPAR